MSIPQNELGRFRSYSYHHILMVCNNASAAEELTNTSEITTFQHPIDRLRFKARTIGNDDNNKYITLIDGTSDARFYITEASWENVIAMEDYIGDSNIPQSSSMSLEGELEIIEPLGANFLNVLTNVCDELETDPVGLMFVLKTIFVGHNDEGSTEMISNIKPLLFVNYDITALFDSSGSKYKMLFVGAVNGLAKLPQTQQIVNGFQFKVNTNDTLEKTFERLSGKINDAYRGSRNKAISEYAKILYDASKKEGRILSASESVSNALNFFISNYRQVEYKIFAPDYSNIKYKAGDNDNVRIANKVSDASYNFGTNIGIETIIKKMMASSTAVLKDAKNNDDGKKYVYKIVSGLNSTKDGFVVEYHVKKYEMLMLPYESAFEGKEFTPVPGQSIEFNYIFTGKNVDIKEFDIKMELGMAFFQIAATTDSLPTQQNVKDGLNSSVVKTSGSACVASKTCKVRPFTPLFLGSKLQNPMTRNTRNPVDSAAFQALINRQAALENIEAKMTIFGNITLLGEMQILPSDLGKPSAQLPQPKENKTVNPGWLKTPTLIKVNIKMPVDTGDVNTEYNDFWYTGYYTLFAVKQIFSNGEFLQELDMMSLPVADKLETGTDKPPVSDDEKDKQKKKDKTVYRQIDKSFGVQTEEKAEKQTVQRSRDSRKRSQIKSTK